MQGQEKRENQTSLFFLVVFVFIKSLSHSVIIIIRTSGNIIHLNEVVLMCEYKDIKNNVYPITHISRISDDAKEEVQLQIVEELCAIFANQ